MRYVENEQNENIIVNSGYEMANKIYNRFLQAFKNLRVEKDDFIQEAVMYVLNLYRKEYFVLKPNLTPNGIIYNLLVTFAKNEIQKKFNKNKKSGKNLNNPIYPGGEETFLDILPDEKGLSPEEQTMQTLEEKNGKVLLQRIVNSFDVTEYTTSKHTYKGTFHKALGKNFKFSEKNIGTLLMLGKTTKEILWLYNIKTTNIGSDSKATLINRKIKYTIAKIGEEIKKLSLEEQELVKAYILSR